MDSSDVKEISDEMNGNNSDTSIQSADEMDDLDNLPHNLARFARSSYSRKEIEEDEQALMEGTEENVANALRIEKLPCSDDIDNIKDDKLVKKIKEEQMIKKIRNEIETTVKKAHNCSEEEQQNEEKNISEIGGGATVEIDHICNNGVEEPEDEVVSYKTETDQESTRTNSRSSELSCAYSANNITTSHHPNSQALNVTEGIAVSVNDLLGHSVIVREHNDSSDSLSDEAQLVSEWELKLEKPKASQKRIDKCKKKTTTKKRQPQITNGVAIPKNDNAKSLKTQELHLKTDQENLSMSPTVIIKGLNMKDKGMKKKLAYHQKLDEPIIDKVKKQTSINSYFSPPKKQAKVGNGDVDESISISRSSGITEDSKQQHATCKDSTMDVKNKVNLKLDEGGSRTDDNEHCGDSQRSSRTKPPVLSTENYGENECTHIDSAESDISDTECEGYPEPTNQPDNSDSTVEVPFLISQRGRRLGKANYIYESSSEHTSDAEASRTASPATALKGACFVPDKSVTKLLDKSDTLNSNLSVEIDSEEKQIVPNTSNDLFDSDDKLDHEWPCKHVVGELAWARVGISPYWPCTITYDPDLKIFSYVSKLQANGVTRSHRQYHVQFFGKPQRAWVKEQGILQYEGIEAFNEAGLKHKKSSSKKSDQKKKFNTYCPSTKGAKSTWHAAVEEMLESHEMSSEERLIHVRSLFEASAKLDQQRALERKLKRKRENSGASMASTASSLSTSAKPISPPTKKLRGLTDEPNRDEILNSKSIESTNYGSHASECATDVSQESSPLTKSTSRFPSIDRLIKAIPANKLEENRRKLKTGFKLFQLANAETVKTKNLDGIESSDKSFGEPDKNLNQKWNALTFAERKFYQDMVRAIYSHKDEDGSSVCSEDNDDTYILDSEDDAFKEEDDKDSIASDLSSMRKPNKATPKSRANKKQTFVSPPLSTNSVEHSPCGQKITNDMVGLFKKENCCLVCEEVTSPSQGHNGEQDLESEEDGSKKEKVKEDPIVKCRGGCHNTYHLSCVGENRTVKHEEWKCNECQTGKHSCFLCKAVSSREPSVGLVEKCSQNGCGKYFHRACLKRYGLWPQARYSEHALTCPGHICHTCASDNPKDPYMKYNTKLLKCIRCPTTYHSGDHCVAAGSVQITMTQIICPKHFSTKNSGKKYGGKSSGRGHFNANWCFICSKGGALICCERCPASFHKDCLVGQLDGDILPDKYYCDNCETGRMPLYGEILWVKLGQYRWWPAQVIHPANLPTNIDKLPHDIGEFPVQFCGTNEYYWMNQGRCFLYEEGDAEGKNAVSATFGNANALNASFRRGLLEAAELFEALVAERAKREAANMAKAKSTGWQKHIKPPLYTKIKFNQPVGDCPVYKADPLDQQTCECDLESEDPCGENSECLNRLLLCECRPSTCPGGERCENQRFQKRCYPKLRVTKTTSRGWGLTLHEDVQKGTFIIEYVGELITMTEFHNRIERSRQRKEEHNYYYMTMDACRMIDAGPKGNIARFMNHSCDPNCETQKWTVNGDTKVGIFALKDIPNGTELTFNYQFEVMGDVKQICLCGSKNCSGYIEEKPSKPLPDSSLAKEGKVSGDKSKGTRCSIGEEKDKNNKKKKKQKKTTKTWEDLCFRCYEDGQLLMCDWKNCPKVYHLACLGREKMPREKWFCPWHHCVTCGKPAASYCIHCPNAYCVDHDNVIFDHSELGRMCDEHEEDIENLLEFYRTVTNGVASLPANPNINLDPTADGSKLDEETAGTDERHCIDAYLKPADIHTPPDQIPIIDDCQSQIPSDTQIAIDDNENTKKNEKIDFDSDSITITERWMKTKYNSDPDILSKVIIASKKKIKKIHCVEADCNWTGRKATLVAHLEQDHEHSSDNSKKLGSLALELAIRRRQEAASVARRLSLEIEIAQISNKPKKTLNEIKYQETSTNSCDAEISRVEFSKTESPKPSIPKETHIKHRTHLALGQSEINAASPSPSKVEILYKCPVCNWAFRGSLFWRHLAKKHPGHQVEKENIVKVGPAIDLNTGKASLKAKPIEDTHVNGSLGKNDAIPAADQDEIKSEGHMQSSSCLRETRTREINRDSTGSYRKMSPEKIYRASADTSDIFPNTGRKKLSTRTTAENEKAFSPGHSLCSECGKFVHSSNTARHWRSQHPHLEYSPRKFSNNQNRIQEDEHYPESNSETASSICSNLWPTKRKSDSYQDERSRKTSVDGSDSKIVATRSSNRIKENTSTITMNGKDNKCADGTPEEELEHISTPFANSVSTNEDTVDRIFTKIKCGHQGCAFSAISLSSVRAHRKEMNHSRTTNEISPESSQKMAMANKFKKRAIRKILHKEAKARQELDTGALLPNGLPRKWRSCGYEGCEYRTQYKANLNRHQNHYGHRCVTPSDEFEIKKQLKASDDYEDSTSIVSSLPDIKGIKCNTVKGSKTGDEVVDRKSHTVIGRDRDGNDVMADGSIKLRTQTISKEITLHSITNSTASPSQPDSHLSFDISACIGSPEKLSPVQVDSAPLDVDHLPTPHILSTKD